MIISNIWHWQEYACCQSTNRHKIAFNNKFWYNAWHFQSSELWNKLNIRTVHCNFSTVHCYSTVCTVHWTELYVHIYTIYHCTVQVGSGSFALCIINRFSNVPLIKLLFWSSPPSSLLPPTLKVPWHKKVLFLFMIKDCVYSAVNLEFWQKFDSRFLEPYSWNLELCFKKNLLHLSEFFSTGNHIKINHKITYK